MGALTRCTAGLPDQDTPDGQYAHLEKSGKKQKSKPWKELWNGCTNYRMWGLAACYAYTFGVEVRPPMAGERAAADTVSPLRP